MLCGDFNARIGNLKDFIIDDPFSNIEHISNPSFRHYKGLSRDTHVNPYGRSLVDL